jgi:hypothetical protein
LLFCGLLADWADITHAMAAIVNGLRPSSSSELGGISVTIRGENLGQDAADIVGTCGAWAIFCLFLFLCLASQTHTAATRKRF